MKKIIFIIITCLLLISCATQPKIEEKEDNKITGEATLDFLKGKPTLIFFASTSCPISTKKVYEFEWKIWDKYKDKINVLINVIDGGRFNIKEVPQVTDMTIDFFDITGNVCDYVPSWILLNSKGEVIDTSCGGEKDFDYIERELNRLSIIGN